VLETYPFSEPNRIPVLVSDRRLYPYHTFEGYSTTSQLQEWKVVKLENDLIEVYVLPEVGGKVWGAVVKETGREFIYRNEVMKFRDIALRGPWTSGGIEFNFGIIGHTPTTATPVDYTLRHNDDGSVSCFVGAMDLPSRTHWRVEIRLHRNRADFETHAQWYNPTPLEQPYYNWMTAAAFAQDDLEIFVPGGAYLEHSGRERPWPFDEEGRFLPLYRNNAFGGSKSYHVVGELNDFFGGYYHDDDYGWGHWARYEDMPGQKMWLWALSRAGGVWEDLLTDTDGQYVEFQAGRLFVQYSPGNDLNPITQAVFDPVSARRWTETWFPLQGIGGLTDASREGAMYVEQDGARLRVAVHAFGSAPDTIFVSSDGRLVAAEPVALEPLQPVHTSFEIIDDRPFRVVLPSLGLDYTPDPAERMLDRSFSVDPDAWPSVPMTDRLVFEARELAKGRRYKEARALFEEVIAAEPWNRAALLGLVSLALRSARYEDGLVDVRRVLQFDTYDARANFLAGNLYRALGRFADARDAFGWAARSVAFRAAAHVQLAELMLERREWKEARRYAEIAIDFDRYSVPAWQLLALIARRAGDDRAAEQARAELITIDPLHHFVLAEGFLAKPSLETSRGLTEAMRSEYPDQTLLELAIGYANRSFADDALSLLSLADETGDGDRVGGPLITVWYAFLSDDPAHLGTPTTGDLELVFPFRPETLRTLEWATEHSSHWSYRYLLALNLWALNRDTEAAGVIAALGDQPDYGPAYIARGYLLQEEDGRDPGEDFARAVELDPRDRLLRVTLIHHILDTKRWDEAVLLSTEARRDFPDDFNITLLHARGLVAVGRASEAIEVLDRAQVLPSENARDSHRLYVLAHLTAALDDLEANRLTDAREHVETALLWPESLGQGRPFDPDERLVRYLEGVTAEAMGNVEAAESAFGLADFGTEGAAGIEHLVQGDGGFFVAMEGRLLRRAEAMRR